MSSKKIWKLKQADPEAVNLLSRELGLSTIISKLLVNRKITTVDEATRFLNADLSQLHDPFLLKDMNLAVERIVTAILHNEKICIFGDYDVDGAVATAMLVLFFEELGVTADFYIPNRMTEGYSLNRGALQVLKERGTHLVITVDNGVMAHKEILWAAEKHLDIIVTDHHKTGETLPPALAVVNPQRADCCYPFKGICGAGVAFKLMMALRQTLRSRGFFEGRREPNLKQYLDLLCVATVCDVVPLIDENRIIVREGLNCLRHTQRQGLQALLTVCDIKDREMTTIDLGFKLGPRINACGRLKDAAAGVMMLISQTKEPALKNARLLDSLNEERKNIELGIVADVILRIENEINLDGRLGLVLYDKMWHEGIVGIVASKIVDKFKRPAVILSRGSDGNIKGSGRSVPKVSLIRALQECADLLIKFGGHEAAAGVTLTTEKLGDFTMRFNEAVKKQMNPADVVQTVLVDEILKGEDITAALVADLNKLEPHGMGNFKPVFVIKKTRIKSKRVVGEKHLKLLVDLGGSQMDAIAFNKGGYHDRIGLETGLVFGLEFNTFRDKTQVQMVVKDFF
ncbi:MAG: single-stranded-DNA-specific exonuclease RecJ [Deltaproteobacteria bacterium]|nr:single-stranded-DNA-specific exonuclease RecJ [Deltaproteobacteria bacterium]